MRRRSPPRLALALLEHLVPDSGPLAGDLIEEFESGRSSAWFWWQVLAAIVVASCERPSEIRPLQLVDLQPQDAVERTNRMRRRFHPVNLRASPISAAGGLGLVLLACLLTLVRPAMWFVLLGATAAGLVFSIVLILRHRSPPPGTTIRLQ